MISIINRIRSFLSSKNPNLLRFNIFLLINLAIVLTMELAGIYVAYVFLTQGLLVLTYILVSSIVETNNSISSRIKNKVIDSILKLFKE
jgi:hypothetical protein